MHTLAGLGWVLAGKIAYQRQNGKGENSKVKNIVFFIFFNGQNVSFYIAQIYIWLCMTLGIMYAAW